MPKDIPHVLKLPAVDPLSLRMTKSFGDCIEKLTISPNALQSYAFNIDKLKRKEVGRLVLLAGLIALTPLGSAAQPVALPIGARETITAPVEAGTFELPIGPFTADTQPTRRIEGTISRSAYKVSLDRNDTFTIFKSLRETLTQQGYSTLFQCSDNTCGGFDFRYGIDVLSPPEMEVDLTDYHFATLEGPEDSPGHLTLLVSQNSNTGFIQFINIEPIQSQALPLEEVTPLLDDENMTPSDWSAELEATGRAVLEGIIFETGQTRLTAESNVVLEEFANFLSENQELNFLIVGHSDNTGSLDANINLSRNRAEAVRQTLIADYAVAANRLSSAGAGFLSPRALNSTDEGKASNRRVEIVLR